MTTLTRPVNGILAVAPGTTLLGEIITWSCSGVAIQHLNLVTALRDSGLDESVARELAPRHAFSRACKKLSEQRIIRQVAEDDKTIQFQFTAEHKEGDHFTYDLETMLSLHKESGKVSCDLPGLATLAQEELDRCIQARTGSDVTKVVQRLFERTADLFPIRDQGGAYWREPARYPERARWQARVVDLLGQGVRPCLPQRTIRRADGVQIAFHFIPPGTFLMGSPENEEGRQSPDEPQHQWPVTRGICETLYLQTVTRGFWLGIHPVTQGQWRAVLGINPSRFPGDDRLPVERVNWEDCSTSCARWPPGRGSGCGSQRRPNGNGPAGRARQRPSLLGRHSRPTWRTTMAATVTAGVGRASSGNRPPPLAAFLRTPGGSTTCTGTSGSGAKRGTAGLANQTQEALRVVIPVPASACAAVPGAAVRGPAARLVGRGPNPPLWRAAQRRPTTPPAMPRGR